MSRVARNAHKLALKKQAQKRKRWWKYRRKTFYGVNGVAPPREWPSVKDDA